MWCNQSIYNRDISAYCITLCAGEWLSQYDWDNKLWHTHKVSNIAGSGCIYIRVDFNILLDRQIWVFVNWSPLLLQIEEFHPPVLQESHQIDQKTILLSYFAVEEQSPVSHSSCAWKWQKKLTLPDHCTADFVTANFLSCTETIACFQKHNWYWWGLHHHCKCIRWWCFQQ